MAARKRVPGDEDGDGYETDEGGGGGKKLARVEAVRHDPYKWRLAPAYEDLFTPFLGFHQPWSTQSPYPTKRTSVTWDMPEAYRGTDRKVRVYDADADDWSKVSLTDAIGQCHPWGTAADGDNVKRRPTRGTGCDVIIIREDEAAHISPELFFRTVLPIMRIERPRIAQNLFQPKRSDKRDRSADDRDDDCTDDGGTAHKRRRPDVQQLPTAEQLRQYMLKATAHHWYWARANRIIGRAARDADGDMVAALDVPWV